MKHPILLIAFCVITLSVNSQFVQKPLNFPAAGYYSCIISVVNSDNVWIGVRNGYPSYSAYSNAIHTNNGGNSWIFDSIPVPDVPCVSSVMAVNANTCFYLYNYSVGSGTGGSLWKTTDGGSTWANKFNTQYTGNFPDFYVAFSGDTGVAVGDANPDYFEIQLTNDGGNTWTRVPSTNIPAPQGDEMGWWNAYFRLGDTLWFPTNWGRCFRSVDRGHTWSATMVDSVEEVFDLCFSNHLKGAFWSRQSVVLKITNDGGSTWTDASFPTGYLITSMSRVQGFNNGFVFLAYKGGTSLSDVFFTPDHFTNIIKIASGLNSDILFASIAFYDATTGWVTGPGTATDNIFKFNGLITSVYDAANVPESVTILPNPSAGEALVKLPASLNSKPLVLRITDMAGNEIEHHVITSSTGWTKLDATGYANGVYLVGIVSVGKLVACERWIINH